MNEAWQAIAAIALVAILVLMIVALFRLAALARARDGAAREAADLRARLDAFAQAAAEHERDMRADLGVARREQGEAATVLRREVGDRLAQFQSGTQQSLADANTAQREQLKQFGERIGTLTQTVEQKLDGLRNENAKKLDEMRATVDEKLQTTLDTRLGESFKQVSERLEQVHRGLGEMQNLAVGVGDLKRVLSNVRSEVKRLGIRYPVVIDNDYKIWRAYHNQYWPAAYYADATGKIRFYHFGEGRYEEQDQAVAKLLAEAAVGR